MIDWFGLFHNSLWVLGTAVAFAALGYADWHRHLAQPRAGLRDALDAPGFQAAFYLGLLLFSTGLALGSRRWWEIVAWSALALLCGRQAGVAWLRTRPGGRPQQPGQPVAPNNNRPGEP